jgi:transcriptional regulator with XRE-family HTH domain
VVETVLDQFAENLRRQRERRGLSQERLAEMSDLHRTSVSDYECRNTTPSLDSIVKLARGLELASPCELLEGIV